MKALASGDLLAPQSDRAYVSEFFHSVSQPLTALQCGLELSLRQDKTVRQFRARLKTALGAAQLLHQKLLEARALQDATEPGDTSRPVALQDLLSQLREDFLPIAKSAKLGLDVRCETAMVHGNEARLRNGLFHLLDFLVRTCPMRRTIRVRQQSAPAGTVQLSFSNYEMNGSGCLAATPVAGPADLGFQIAQRTIQAAGGDLVVTWNQRGQFAGYMRLLLAH
jgi:hypothetical protein